MSTAFTYQEQKFDLPPMKGISEKQVAEHLKLYAGYVKNTNLVLAKTAELAADAESNAYLLAELRRRLAFEFNGMRLHEYYFEQLGGDGTMSPESPLGQALAEQYGSVEDWVAHVTTLGMMRGIGWVITYFDPKVSNFQTAWVGDHEIGHRGGLPIVSALDVWEHAFLLDYLPSQRKEYIEAFFSNLKWAQLEERFKTIRG